MIIDKFKIFCHPISGKKLCEFYPEYSKLLYPDLVSDTPGIAIKKIVDFFNVYPSINGNNISGIVDIRDNLFQISEHKEFANAFAIVASHTHWIDRKPIIYHYLKQENKYIIGTHSIHPDEIYYPVTFAFHDNFPLAFEWCESKLINENELNVAIDIVIILNKSIFEKKYPLGIAIDFRFKSTLFEKSLPTIELPIDERRNKFFGYSKIITLEKYETNQQGEMTEQVAWQPFSDLLLELNEEEFEILKELRTYITSKNELNIIANLGKISRLIKK